MKLSLFILAVALIVSLLFRLIEWPWVAFRQADAAITHGNYNDAAELYERAAQKLDDLRVLEPLAKCWLALGRSREAEALLGRILEKHPDQLPAIELLSGLYQKSKRPDKAIPLFVQYLAMDKKLDPRAELQLARIYRQAARYDDAAPLYLRAAAEDPKQKSVCNAELAEMRSWQGQYDEAITLFREVLQTDPANRHVRLELARALSWARRYKESEDEYQKILKKP